MVANSGAAIDETRQVRHSTQRASGHPLPGVMVVCMSRLPNYSFEATREDRVAVTIVGRRRAVACRLKSNGKVETACFIPWLRPRRGESSRSS